MLLEQSRHDPEITQPIFCPCRLCWQPNDSLFVVKRLSCCNTYGKCWGPFQCYCVADDNNKTLRLSMDAQQKAHVLIFAIILVKELSLLEKDVYHHVFKQLAIISYHHFSVLQDSHNRHVISHMYGLTHLNRVDERKQTIFPFSEFKSFVAQVLLVPSCTLF